MTNGRARERRALGLMMAAAGSLAGCELSEVGLFEIPPPAAVGVSLRVEVEEVEIAAVLGWPSGALPDADVTIERVDGELPWAETFRSDGEGGVEVGEVAPGRYRVVVQRVLGADERAAAGGVVGFMSEHRIQVGTQPPPVLRVPASRAGSLVFSEVKSLADGLASGFGGYRDATYFEIYNNADTTIHLDGKLLGQGYVFTFEPLCTPNASMRLDDRGIWSRQFEHFPGSGTDHPLAPGEVVYVAKDAIDHRPFAPTAPDLRGAGFESIGTADVDNPAVPNMIRLGTVELPRGFEVLTGIVFLADPVDVTSLPVDGEFRRIPADRILDVTSNDLDSPGLATRCPQPLHQQFDRNWFLIPATADGYAHLSFHRRALLTLPDGRRILQDTNDSRADFVAGEYSPGEVTGG